MSINFESGIGNLELKKKLLNRRNLLCVEDLLNTNSQNLERLRPLYKNNTSNFGKPVSRDELTTLFPKIRSEVDEFLGVQDIKSPSVDYFNLIKSDRGLLVYGALSAVQTVFLLNDFFTTRNSAAGYLCLAGLGVMQLAHAAVLYSNEKSAGYFHESERINLKKVTRTHLIPVAGHEYAHHVLHAKLGIKDNYFSSFEEGFARGVEKMLAEKYCENEDNEAFIYPVLERTVGELKSTYLWMCKLLNQKPNGALLKSKTSRDKYERSIFLKPKPTPHALGNTFFSILENENGHGIYSQIINKN